jgi:hypothetical protein
MNESAWEQLMSFVVTKLTAEDVRKAIELFWSTFLAKSEEELNDFYAPGSTVFQIAMGRSEPGRLGAMRRSREYFSPDTRMELKLRKRTAEKLETVRATHVMHRDASGKVRIAHEHFSVPVA